ncbi:Aa-trans domain-containing protein [Aphelenchoides bicaudatus]|nr:Aa-trans domain-containing protein [Aphelenchoides bicaudatus]
MSSKIVGNKTPNDGEMADAPETMPADIKDGSDGGSENEMEMKTGVDEGSVETKTAMEKSLKEVTTSSKEKSFGMNEKGHFVRRTGINWILAALFIIADMAGGGIVAVPASVQNLYFVPGVVFSLMMAGIAMWTCSLLGRCWVMLQQRFPEYRDHCRQVFAEIGYRSLGKWGKTWVTITIGINQLGVSVIYLLLAAKSINDAVLTLTSYEHLHYCYVILILALILLPLNFLKSPEDFWPVTFAAMACSVLSVVFICIGSALDYSKCSPTKDEFFNNIRHITPMQTISAFGTLVFSYGGHASFPVILHDMKRPSQFVKSSYLAFGLQVLLYVPMSIVASLTYGGHIKASVINSIQTVWAQQAVNLMICLHCITALLLMLNPLNQDAEERLKVPHHFGWKRVVVRTGVLFVVTFLAVSVPSFGPIIDLVGATTTLLTVLIFPPLFYFCLTASGNIHAENTEKSLSKKVTGSDEKADAYPVVSFKEMIRYNSKFHLAWGFFIMLLGAVICVSATTSAVYELSHASFEYPCYVQPFITMEKRLPTATFCCGPGVNGTLATQEGMICLDGSVVQQSLWKKP